MSYGALPEAMLIDFFLTLYSNELLSRGNAGSRSNKAHQQEKDAATPQHPGVFQSLLPSISQSAVPLPALSRCRTVLLRAGHENSEGGHALTRYIDIQNL